MGKGEKIRIDRLLVERGLVDTRTRAAAMVIAGEVVVDDKRVDKPGAQVPATADVRLRPRAGEVLPYVSRGGLKLAGALDTFTDVVVTGRVAMDVGASTGGFTDVLLQRGAARVHAVDVGYGQLAWKIANDPRVVVHDRTNIRTADPTVVGEPIELVVIDCSFVSLTKVLPALPPFLAPGADVVALIKPQFEVGPEGVGKGGIVKQPALHEAAKANVCAAAESLGFTVRGDIRSPILGREGNVEFLVWLTWDGAGKVSEP
jgi:23S rRNA (cytidine1920-2'-O)/16S rRNA (cytidine1409-2'-O)-methyltransferase